MAYDNHELSPTLQERAFERLEEFVKGFPVWAGELQSGEYDIGSAKEADMTDPISITKFGANQRRTRKAKSPKDTGSTRYNAAKHGLLASGITELDDARAYKALLQRLNKAHQPVGDIETFLVERIALAIVRLRRIARMEAEYITGELHPPVREMSYSEKRRAEDEPVLDPGQPAAMSVASVISLGGTFQRSETAIENKLYRAMNELERLQRMRQGEHVAAPATVDVAVHGEDEGMRSFGKR